MSKDGANDANRRGSRRAPRGADGASARRVRRILSRVAGLAALGLILCVVALALVMPPRASALTLAPRPDAAARAPLVEAAQYQHRRKMRGQRARHKHVAQDDDTRKPDGHGPKDGQQNEPHDPGHTPDTHPTGTPDGSRPPEHPRHPLVRLFPDLSAKQADALRALPHRELQAPPNRPLRQKVTRQILVLLDAARPTSLGAELARDYGLEALSSRPIALLSARAELFRVRAGRSEDAVLAALRRDRRIRSAQFNWRYFHTGDERQEQHEQHEHEQQETASIPQYGPRLVHLPEAHELALGRKVTVAVIDSAVDTAHPDLAGAVASAFDMVGGDDATPDFHGTAIAGIIRSRGVVDGVAPQSDLMAVRAFRTRPGAPPETTTELLLGAIDWAIAHGARVINMSFVGPRNGQLEELLKAAQRKGIVLVAAAGNAGPKAPPAFPAAFPGVIAVTAVDADDHIYPHANRGSYIAVAAPGVDVLAPVEGGKHELLSGTSFATAYVSGIAALLLERDPSMDAAMVARLIAAGADDLGAPGRDDNFGAGRVNALAALKSVHAVAAR
jgi:subtilase family protein